MRRIAAALWADCASVVRRRLERPEHLRGLHPGEPARARGVLWCAARALRPPRPAPASAPLTLAALRPISSVVRALQSAGAEVREGGDAAGDQGAPPADRQGGRHGGDGVRREARGQRLPDAEAVQARQDGRGLSGRAHDGGAGGLHGEVRPPPRPLATPPHPAPPLPRLGPAAGRAARLLVVIFAMSCRCASLEPSG